MAGPLQILTTLMPRLCKWTHTSQGHKTQPSSLDFQASSQGASLSPATPQTMRLFPRNFHKVVFLQGPSEMFPSAAFMLYKMLPPCHSPVPPDSSLWFPSQVPSSPRWTCLTSPLQFRVFHLPPYTHRPSQDDRPLLLHTPKLEFPLSSSSRFLGHVLETPSLH